MTTPRAVVTGAAGFLGARLSARLLDDGWTVLGVDNFDPFYPRARKERALAPVRRRPGFTLLECDVRDAARLCAALRPDDVVVHLAARAGVRRSLGEARAYRSINVAGTATLRHAVRARGVRRVVFASSSSVYGAGADAFREDRTALAPRSPYGWSKVAGEREWESAAREDGVRAALLRFFSLYGPGQRPDQAVWAFGTRLARNVPIDIFGSLDTARDFTYVDDAVAAVTAAVRWTERDARAATAFNVGSGRAVSLREVVGTLATLLGVTPAIRLRPAHPADPERTLADLERARRVLGYRPAVSLDRGLQAFIQWLEVGNGHQSRAAS